MTEARYKEVFPFNVGDEVVRKDGPYPIQGVVHALEIKQSGASIRLTRPEHPSANYPNRSILKIGDLYRASVMGYGEFTLVEQLVEDHEILL